MNAVRTIVMISGTCAIGASAHGASFQGVGDLPGGAVSSTIGGISADGKVVVGISSSANGTNEAFRWDAINGIVGLGDLAGGAFSSSARAVSADGSIIIGNATNATGGTPYRWDAVNGMVPLSTIVASVPNFSVSDVSDDGSVMAGTGEYSPGDARAVRWDAVNGAVDLGDVPNGPGDFGQAISGDGSVVVGIGHYSGSVNWEAFRWNSDEGMTSLPNLPDIFYSEASGVNTDGTIVVGIMHVSVPGPVFTIVRAFKWTQATGMVALGYLPSSGQNHARATNADGTVIVGSATLSSGPSSAMIWREGIGVQRLSTVLTDEYDLDLTGWTLSAARGISADGLVIVGSGTNPQGKPEVWVANLAPTPPSCDGDITGDNVTNAADFNVLASHFNQSVTPNTNGDLNGDGTVNAVDFNILAGDFGCGTN